MTLCRRGGGGCSTCLAAVVGRDVDVGCPQAWCSVLCIVPTSKLGEMFTVKMMEGMLIFYRCWTWYEYIPTPEVGAYFLTSYLVRTPEVEGIHIRNFFLLADNDNTDSNSSTL
eukprot:scaffold22173_cov64-Cyclotella_meneghiniana.AAC.2